MKYLFFVQSEGRGHFTQALTLAEQLRQHGHEVCAAILNDNPVRHLPLFFKEGINCPLIFLSSPYFLPNKDGKGVNMFKSVFYTFKNVPKYLKSLKAVNNAVNQYQPDILINFYEPLSGTYSLFFGHKRPLFSIGHQFFLEHRSFKIPKYGWMNFLSLKFYNQMVAYGSNKIIALSFTDEPDQKKIVVCPPLIRSEIKKITPSNHNFILSYLLNCGYYNEIEKWSLKNKNYRVEAFWDKSTEDQVVGDNLTFHPIGGATFIDYITNCSLYAATAGFDSIAEAAYLQKDILMVPTKNHFEQACNAIDANRASLAISDTFFNIDKLLDWQKKRPTEAKRIFKDWVDSQSEKIIKIITSV
jgi:uncharacterized protein (TIGR00661 family)